MNNLEDLIAGAVLIISCIALFLIFVFQLHYILSHDWILASIFVGIGIWISIIIWAIRRLNE
jgi:hypothetical protein